MGWGGICKRRVKVLTLAVVVYLDYKAMQTRVQWFSKGKKDVIWEKTHKRNAKRILNLMLELEGLWVKLGQYLSTRADVLPEAYLNLLKQMQDSLPPRKLQEICRTIEGELGTSVKDLFSNFVVEPLATASIAQVHRATLKDGREVVVKVQHEGIKEVILEDLKNAKSIVDWIAWAEPQYNFNPMIEEWWREAPKELDFNREADNTRKVAENLHINSGSNGGDHHKIVDVLIPHVIQSSEKVLILQYMDSIRLNDKEKLEAFGVDKQKLVEEITRAYAHQIYVDGFFNGDPHPGNFLVSKEAPHRPILLDFGLTKSISKTLKQALAKMFLACSEGDHVALLSAFSEMGLNLRLDMPEQAMNIATMFFRSSAPAGEALENEKSLNDERERNLKAIQEKSKLSDKEFRHFNPVDAFPSDVVIFMRVLDLLRGLSSTLNVRMPYLDIMRPFAELALVGSLRTLAAGSREWIHDSPVHSNVETKLRQLLVELGNDKILGIQVCAYKDGKVIIDTAAGVLGKYDPRPVQPDTLFSVFSATKGITAGMTQWLVDKGKLSLDQDIASIWPEFKSNMNAVIKVHHVLNHSSGLHNAMSDILKSNPLLMSDWEESLHHIAKSTPETEPGSQQLYHYLSFGWLCGGIIEHASGKKFQEVLEEAIIRPLNIGGELYIGIPPGVESRLAALTLDIDVIAKLKIGKREETPTSIQPGNVAEMALGLPFLFNTLNIRRAIIPAANAHCSARALARYYAALANKGSIPPPHSELSKPTLGSHSHLPTFPSMKIPERRRQSSNEDAKTDATESNGHVPAEINDDVGATNGGLGMFTNTNIHQACMGLGEYSDMVIPGGKFGLGFRRLNTADGKLTSFGHSGIGGPTGFCDVEHNFAIAITVNKMSLGHVTRSIIQLVCSELNVPLPEEYSDFGEKGPDMNLNMVTNV